MNQRLAHITLVVRDYDEAIAFYTQKLHFTLVEDTPLSDTKRWVLVAPKGSKECRLLLAKAANADQLSRVGNQTGGRVFLFLHTDNFKRDYQNLLDQGINIVRPPSVEPYGTVAVFEDLYGNQWDLIEPARRHSRRKRLTLLTLFLGSFFLYFFTRETPYTAWHRPTEGNTVTILLIDGLSKRIFREMLAEGQLPHLQRLIGRSTLVQHGIAAFPTMTGYGFYPFVTGADASRSGILGLRWFDRSRTAGNLRNYVGRTNVHMNADIRALPQTIFEHYDSFYTASVNTYMNRGVHHAEMTGWAHTTSKYQSQGMFKALRHIPVLGKRIAKNHFEHEALVLEKAMKQLARNPKVQWVTFPGPDASNHVCGTTDEYYRLLVHLDSLIGRFVAEVERLGQADTRMIAVVTDHGIADVSLNLDVPAFLEKNYGIALERGKSVNLYSRELDEPLTDFMQKHGYFVINGNLSAYIYLREPVPVATAQHWKKRLPFLVLSQYPSARGPVCLPELIAGLDGVELVACRPNDSTVSVYGKNGRADIVYQPARGYRYAVFGTDPLGYGAFPALQAMIRAGFHPPDAWLEASLDTDFPDALYRLYCLMSAEQAGDLLLTAQPGYDLAPDYELFVHNYKGGHGGLRAELSDVPYILHFPGAGADTLPWARAEDVGRLILSHLSGKPRSEVQ